MGMREGEKVVTQDEPDPSKRFLSSHLDGLLFLLSIPAHTPPPPNAGASFLLAAPGGEAVPQLLAEERADLRPSRISFDRRALRSRRSLPEPLCSSLARLPPLPGHLDRLDLGASPERQESAQHGRLREREGLPHRQALEG